MTAPRIAVVTGGASGIGLAFAKAYAARGAHIVIGDIDETAMDAARRSLEESGATVDCIQVDLSDAASVRRLADAACALGELGAVCMNAGVTSTGSPVWETVDATYDFVIGVNLRGLFHSIKAFVPVLIQQDGPSDLVITASMAGMVASPYSGVYGASKAAAIALAKTVRAELSATAPAVRVALLNPGMVKTNLIRTSAARLPANPTMSADLVTGMHDALNQAGVEPDVAVGWALKALEDNSFWALPGPDDPFTGMLEAELGELRSVTSS